tara:strand:- start:3738 stop:4259 length:522 start_codon:yes stop_codon:yes gene_type:complete
MANSSADLEWFDVVDENDRVIGKETRGEVHRKKLLHRAIHVFVFNSSGQLYLQKRSATKDTAPNRWVSSCSGHVDSGEDYETAARRELGEELGIDGNSAELEEIRAVDAVRETGHEFVRLYQILRYDGAIIPDPAEVSDGIWKKPDEIEEWIARAPREFSLSFLYLWNLFRKE